MCENVVFVWLVYLVLYIRSSVRVSPALVVGSDLILMIGPWHGPAEWGDVANNLRRFRG